METFDFQFNSRQFQLTSHFLCQLGKPQGFFWEDYQDTLTVEVWFLSIHIYESVLFSPILTPLPSLTMAGVVCQRWPLLCHCTSSPMWKVCLQSASFPPSSHLPINFLWNAKSPSLSSFLMCDRLYSTLFLTETIAEASTVDLPLTHSPLLLQSMLHKFLSPYFSCLSHKTGGNLAPSSLALFHFFNQSSVTFGHIWFESQIHILIFVWFPNSYCVLVVLVSP